MQIVGLASWEPSNERVPRLSRSLSLPGRPQQDIQTDMAAGNQDGTRARRGK
jgi:hypothetical protein